MPKARKILKRVKAVRGIRAITKTVEMVASVRYRKVHDRLVARRPYITRLTEIVGDLVGECEDFGHPLLREQEEIRHDAMIVLTSNSGLCGPYNFNVLHTAVERITQLRSTGYALELHVVGKRGVQYFNYQRYKIDRAYTNLGYIPDFSTVSAMADEFAASYVSKRISGLEVAYTQYLTSGRQEPVIAQILPLTYTPSTPSAPGAPKAVFEFLPSAEEIFCSLLPTMVRLRLFQCFLDASVSEHLSRIRAMRAATENADEMLHNLTVRYNRMRRRR